MAQRPSGISIKIREDLVAGSARTQTTLICDPIITLDGHRVVMSDIGDICFAKLNQGTSNEEIISFTGITDNTTTYTLTGCVWGYNFYDRTGSVQANKKKQNSGTSLIISTDDHQLGEQFVDIDSTQTIAGAKTFTITPKSNGGDPLVATDLVIKSYVDALVLGTLTTINVIVPGKAGETVAAGNLVYFDLTDNEWKLTDADTAATVENVLLGIAQGAGTNGNAITDGVLLQGVDDNQSGLTEGDVYYAGNTAGGISNSAGTVEVTVGLGKSATELYFNPRFNQGLTEDQQDALAGTSGTPSGTNKYVTNDDTATAATADKVARRLAGGNITVVTESAGNNSTNAASTAYVDAALFNVGKYVQSMLGYSKSLYYNYLNMSLSSLNVGANVTGAHYFASDSASGTGADAISVTANLPTVFTSNFPSATDEINEIYGGYIIQKSGSSVSIYGSIGFCSSAITLATTYTTSITANHAMFLFVDAAVYTSTANGTTQTLSSAIAGISCYVSHYYRIIETSTQVLFYIDDVLVGTHTTNLPTGAIESAHFSTRNAGGTSTYSTLAVRMPIALVNVA